MLWIIDVEATMHADNLELRGFQSEIVQLGIARVEMKEDRLVDVVEFLVAPVRTVAGDRLEKLTGIPAETFNNDGVAFDVVAETLRNSGSKSVPWASWGYYDRLMIEKACIQHSIEPFFGVTHFDLKRIHWMLRRGCQGKPLGLGKALYKEGLTFVGDRHTAGDDAANTAKIVLKLYRELNPRATYERR